jgi:hypothetical protein
VMYGDGIALNMKLGRRFQLPEMSWERQPAQLRVLGNPTCAGQSVGRALLARGIEARTGQ